MSDTSKSVTEICKLEVDGWHDFHVKEGKLSADQTAVLSILMKNGYLCSLERYCPNNGSWRTRIVLHKKE